MQSVCNANLIFCLRFFFIPLRLNTIIYFIISTISRTSIFLMIINLVITLALKTKKISFFLSLRILLRSFLKTQLLIVFDFSKLRVAQYRFLKNNWYRKKNRINQTFWDKIAQITLIRQQAHLTPLRSSDIFHLRFVSFPTSLLYINI